MDLGPRASYLKTQMYKTRNSYSSQSGSTLSSGLFVVGTSLLFSLGLFLIINAHNKSQDNKLQQTIAAIEKSQAEGIDINTALSEIAGEYSGSSISRSSDPGPVNGNFDSLTVKGSTNVIGNMKTERNITAGGDVSVKGDLAITGGITVGGVSTGDLYIQNTSTDPQTSTAIDVDEASTGSLSVTDSASISGDMDVEGSTSIAGDLDIGGSFSTASITVSEATVEGDLYVDGSLYVGGEDLSDILGNYIANGTDPQDADINITGNITTDTLEVIDSVTVANDLTVASGTIYLGADDINDKFQLAGNYVTLEENGDVVIVGALTAASLDASTITIDGVDIETMFQEAGDYQPAGDYQEAGDYVVTNEDASVANLAINGAVTINGLTGSNVDCDTGFALRINRIEHGIVVNAGGGDCIPHGGLDLAEMFPSNQYLSAGDVVSIDPANKEYVIKSSNAGDSLVIGVISTQPGYTLGTDGYPVALAGRVPVKVTNEGGAISPGDYLTPSSTPGYAKKASANEKTIGQAMDSFEGASGTVVMFVNTSGRSVEPLQMVQGTSSNNHLVGLTMIDNLEVTGTTSVVDLQIKGHIIGNEDTRGTVTIPKDKDRIHHGFKTAYAKDPVIVASPTSKATLYKVVATKDGFDIILNEPADADTTFNYLVQE